MVIFLILCCRDSYETQNVQLENQGPLVAWAQNVFFKITNKQISYDQLSFLPFQTVKSLVSFCTTTLLCLFLSLCLIVSYPLQKLLQFTPLRCYGFSPSHDAPCKYPRFNSPLVGLRVYFRTNLRCNRKDEVEKVAIIPIVIGTLGVVSKRFKHCIVALELDPEVQPVQKVCLFGTARIVRKVLNIRE